MPSKTDFLPLEFNLPSEDARQLRDRLNALRCRGDFGTVRQLVRQTAQSRLSPGYDPTRDEVLLELHCIASSAYDHQGDHEKARQLISPWAAKLEIELILFIRRSVTVPPAEARLWYARSWLFQRHGVSFYRAGEYKLGSEYLNISRDLNRIVFDSYGGLLPNAEKRIWAELDRDDVTFLPQVSCLVLWASTQYWIGCLHTYQNEFQQAEADFADGMHLLQTVVRRLSKPVLQRDNATDASNSERELLKQASLYLTARILMGIGLVKFFKGAYRDANSDLLAARILFAEHSIDEIRQRRTDLLLVSVRRHQARADKEKLTLLLEVYLKPIRDDFASPPTEHKRYWVRTQVTIGRLLMDLAEMHLSPQKKQEDFERASGYLEEVEGILTEIAPDPSSNTYTPDRLQAEQLKIRLLRNRQKLWDLARIGADHDYLGEAIERGKATCDQLSTQQHPMLYTDILIALGHALFQRSKRAGGGATADLNAARDCFLKVRQNASSNDRVAAMCDLHLARIYHFLKEKAASEGMMRSWERREHVIEDPNHLDFAKEVWGLISREDTITFDIKDAPAINVYDHMEGELRKFLILRTTADLSDTAAAARLGISRQTLYKWREELQLSSKALATLD